MITVKLYGLLRIESGIKEQQLEAGSMKEVLDALAADLESRIFTYAGRDFNINSPKQLGEILFEVLHGQNKQQCCQMLLDIAKHRGAPDNVTVVLAQL